MIKDIFKINDFVAIYTDLEAETFGLGMVVAFDDKDVIIGSVDPSGNEDGLILYNVDTICKIEKDTQYCQKIKKLMQSKKTSLATHGFGKKILQELLSLAKDNKKLVEIQLQNSHKSDTVGFVESLDNNVCKIRQFDYLGNEDGCCIFLIEDISSVKYDNRESKDTLLLMDL